MVGRLAVVPLLAVVLAGCAQPGQSPAGTATAVPETTTASPTTTTSPTTTSTATASSTPTATPTTSSTALTVAPETSMAGYTRAAFGPPWADVDHNKCDTRDDILARDLIDVTRRGCVVLTGTLRDPYTGKTVPFTRGVGTSTAVQIDHVVALGEAWRSGAAAWTPVQREAFANDPSELLAVAGPVNLAKSDHDPAGWLPPDPAAVCPYLARYVAVKAAYRLTVDPAEQAAIASQHCPIR